VEKNEVFYWLAEASLSKQDIGKGWICGKIAERSNLVSKGAERSGVVTISKERVEGGQSVFLKISPNFPISIHPSIFLMVGQCYLNQNDYQKAKSYDGLTSTTGGRTTIKTRFTISLDGAMGGTFDEADSPISTPLGINPRALLGRIRYWIGCLISGRRNPQAIEEFQVIAESTRKAPTCLRPPEDRRWVL